MLHNDELKTKNPSQKYTLALRFECLGLLHSTTKHNCCHAEHHQYHLQILLSHPDWDTSHSPVEG